LGKGVKKVRIKEIYYSFGDMMISEEEKGRPRDNLFIQCSPLKPMD
jgi:hypothetical protein